MEWILGLPNLFVHGMLAVCVLMACLMAIYLWRETRCKP